MLFSEAGEVLCVALELVLRFVLCLLSKDAAFLGCHVAVGSGALVLELPIRDVQLRAVMGMLVAVFGRVDLVGWVCTCAKLAFCCYDNTWF